MCWGGGVLLASVISPSCSRCVFTEPCLSSFQHPYSPKHPHLQPYWSTVGPWLSILTCSGRLFEKWFVQMPNRTHTRTFSPLFFASDTHDWSYQHQHERVVGAGIEVFVQEPSLFSMSNLVKNQIVRDGRLWRTEVWLYLETLVSYSFPSVLLGNAPSICLNHFSQLN